MRKNTTTLFSIFIALFLISFSNTKSNAWTECGITSIGTISGPSSLCAGDTGVYTYSGTTCKYTGCTLERITYVYCGSTLVYQSSTTTSTTQKIVLQNAGSYTVYGKVKAQGYSYWCKTNTICLTVNAKPQPPTSSCTSISKCTGGSFTLSATPQSNTVIKWYKGNTYISTGNSITATENTIGTYYYYAYSYNSTTGCKSASGLKFTVNITSGPSGLTINAPTTAYIGQAVSISGSASGTGNSFSWNFGSGATPATATGVGSHSVTYSTIGTKTITMTVSNGGCISTLTKTIIICPKAEITCPQSACNNTSISFNASDMGSNAIYSWNFGAGATPTSATGKGPHSVSYSTSGSKTVSLTVTDNTLTTCTSAVTKTIQINGVQNPAITAVSSVVFGDTVTVTGSATGSNLSYSWNFGTDANPATGTGVGPFEVYYSSKGTKIITMNVTDGSCSTSISKEINVCDGYKIDAPETTCANKSVSITATKIGNSLSTCGDTICWVSPTKSYVTAKTFWNETSENITVRTIFSKEFVDNTYGTNKIGWPGNHNFSDLTGSDKLQLALYDANGTKSLEFKIDYLSSSSSASSGYKTLGVTGGDGGMLVGSSSNIVSCLTSLDVNFNQYGYVLTSNSPATDANYTPNSSYPNWIYEVWYEVTVKKSAFGTAGFGYPTIASVHASPSKTGNNTEVVEKTACPTALTWNFGSGATPATATGIGPHSVSYSTTGTKTITLTSSACNTGNCSNVFTKTITVNPGPQASINTNINSVMMNDTVIVTGTSTEGGLTYSWNFGSNANPATATGAGPIKVVYSSIGTKTITLIVNNSSNCSTTLTKAIEVCGGYSINAPDATCTDKSVAIKATQVGNSTSSCGDTICWVSPTKSYVTAKTYWSETSENITIRTIFSKEFVDNTYGSNKIGWPGNHNFSDLTGSDKLQLALYDANGTKSLEFKIDYLSSSSSASSGYKTLGVSGGDGGMLVGSSSNIVSCLTSLDVNFNQYGYVLTTNSPATDANYTPNSSYPNWIYEVWYEVTVKKSAFGSAGFGYPSIASVHASPSKTGNNTEVVEKTACPTALAWNFGSGATPATATGIGPHSVSYSTTGTKTITLTSSSCNTGNCSKVFTKTITVSNGPCAEINIPNFKIFMDTALTYTATQIAGATYTWSATGNAVITGNGNTVTILFPAAGSQTITLVTTLNGCSCTTTKAITVYEPVCQGIKFDYTSVPLKTNMKNFTYIDVTGNTVKLKKATYQSDSFHTSRKFQRNGDTAISWQELTSTVSTSSIKFNRSASDLLFTIRDLDKPSSYNNEMIEVKAYHNGDLISSSKIQSTFNSSNISKISDDGYVVKYKGLNTRTNSSNANDLKLYFISKVDSVFLKLSNTNGNNCNYKSDLGISKMSFCITEPLPVTWLKVKANKNSKGGVNINWATAMEINNDYFTVEKSLDKVNFEAIGTVKGSGNTSVISNYFFEDSKIGNSTAYYRIKQTDFDGKFDYSIVVAVTPDNVIDNVKINPNPASNWVTINWETGMRNDITVQLTNLLGVVIDSQSVPAQLNSYILDLDKVENGFYIINIIHNNTIISKSKLIVKKI